MRYTDDTHMTLATARSLLACEGRFDGPHMAETFATHFEEEPWRGYGAGPPFVFHQLRSGLPWDQAAVTLFGGEGSYGNGAAMRSAPIGLLHVHDLARADTIARESARITHTHALGREGAALQACAVALLVREGASGALDRALFLAELARHAHTVEFRRALDAVDACDPAATPAAVIRELGRGIEAERSVPTALYTFLRHPDSFADAIYFAVGLGGDADTIASMTGALVGGFLGACAIPAPWRSGVEGGSELILLANGLLQLAQRRA
jgi:poly(ADP-ribose) glycohydrolase ARH3